MHGAASSRLLLHDHLHVPPRPPKNTSYQVSGLQQAVDTVKLQFQTKTFRGELTNMIVMTESWTDLDSGAVSSRTGAGVHASTRAQQHIHIHIHIHIIIIIIIIVVFIIFIFIFIFTCTVLEYYILYMCVCPQYMYLRIGSSMHYCRIHIQHLPVVAACHPRRMGRWTCATHGILQIQKPKKLPWRAREALEGRNGKQQLSPQELGRCSALSTAIHQEKANIS